MCLTWAWDYFQPTKKKNKNKNKNKKKKKKKKYSISALKELIFSSLRCNFYTHRPEKSTTMHKQDLHAPIYGKVPDRRGLPSHRTPLQLIHTPYRLVRAGQPPHYSFFQLEHVILLLLHFCLSYIYSRVCGCRYNRYHVLHRLLCCMSLHFIQVRLRTHRGDCAAIDPHFIAS